jgi:hypothetical protein
MTVSFHLFQDQATKSWCIEAHDIRAGRWYVAPDVPMPLQLRRLRFFGVSETEVQRLASLKSEKKTCAWLEAVELDSLDLLENDFTLQPSMSTVPPTVTAKLVARLEPES